MSFLEVIFERALRSNIGCRIEPFKHAFGVGTIIEAVKAFSHTKIARISLGRSEKRLGCLLKW
jgi:hypothetical protein